MSPNEAWDKMQKIQDDFGWDEEAAHVRMDALMCEILEGLGYRAAVEVFKSQEKWYA